VQRQLRKGEKSQLCRNTGNGGGKTYPSKGRAVAEKKFKHARKKIGRHKNYPGKKKHYGTRKTFSIQQNPDKKKQKAKKGKQK